MTGWRSYACLLLLRSHLYQMRHKKSLSITRTKNIRSRYACAYVFVLSVVTFIRLFPLMLTASAMRY